MQVTHLQNEYSKQLCTTNVQMNKMNFEVNYIIDYSKKWKNMCKLHKLQNM